MDVIAMQFVTTADALMVSTNVPSYSNNTGSVTVALFAFDTDYDTSLLASPMAEHTFVDFRDGADLAFRFGEENPLPAGEYLLVLYDMQDPTPTANGGSGTGIGMWRYTPHEGQRTYLNGSFVADMSFSVRVAYKEKPAKLYGIPTKPATSGEIDYAPLMSAVLDFRKEGSTAYLGGGNQTKGTYVTEGGESFLRLTADKDANDPY